MRHLLVLVLFAGMTGGCADAGDDAAYLIHGGPAADPARLGLGVAGDRPDRAAAPEGDAQMRRFLDAKANQLCTLGYDPTKVETIAAEEHQQFVEEQLLCKPYAFSF